MAVFGDKTPTIELLGNRDLPIVPLFPGRNFGFARSQSWLIRLKEKSLLKRNKYVFFSISQYLNILENSFIP